MKKITAAQRAKHEGYIAGVRAAQAAGKPVSESHLILAAKLERILKGAR